MTWEGYEQLQYQTEFDKSDPLTFVDTLTSIKDLNWINFALHNLYADSVIRDGNPEETQIEEEERMMLLQMRTAVDHIIISSWEPIELENQERRWSYYLKR